MNLKLSPAHTRRSLPFLALSAFLVSTLLASADTEDSVPPLESLNQNQLQEAFRALSQHYIDKDSLNYEELNKAALEGLLSRLSFGASIIEKNNAAAADDEPADDFEFYHEAISPKIAYIRPIHFGADEIKATREALKEFKTEEIETLILDFRAPVQEDEFARVAAFADIFTDTGELLFKIAKPGDERPQLFLAKNPSQWDGALILLVDTQTSPAGETAAAVISHFRDCLVVGEKTAGAAVQYQEIALTPDSALRFASAQILLPDGTTLFRNGVTPQFKAHTPPTLKKQVFELSQDKGLARYLFDRERPHMNEAALVSGINPELEFYLAKSNGKETRWDKRPLQDRALQAVIELLGTASFLELDQPAPSKPPLNTSPKPADSPKPGETEEPVKTN
jgi:hypothetical protein